jgi:hypothetical protein
MTGQATIKDVLSVRKAGDGTINFQGMPEYIYCPATEEFCERISYLKTFKKKAKYH